MCTTTTASVNWVQPDSGKLADLNIVYMWADDFANAYARAYAIALAATEEPRDAHYAALEVIKLVASTAKL